MDENLENLLHREDMKLASTQKRSMAFFIDEMLLSFLLIMFFWSDFKIEMTTEELIIVVNSFLGEFVILKIVYQAFFTMEYGATLGKLAMKIRVIEIKTLQTPNVIVALNRAIFRVISEMMFYLGFLWAMMSPSKQGWHDLTAKSLVIDA